MNRRWTTIAIAILFVLAIVVCVGSGAFNDAVHIGPPPTQTTQAGIFPTPAGVAILPRTIATPLPSSAAVAPSSTAVAVAKGTRGLYVEPDDGHAPVIDEIDHAQRTIDLTIYLLTDANVISALSRAESRGVQVRVILEQHPYGGGSDQNVVASTLRDAGIEVRWGASQFTFTHAKYMVIDGEVAIITTQNLSKSSFTANREFGVVTTVPSDVAEAQRIFNADWTGHPGPISGPLVVSPDDSRARLKELIASAHVSIDLYAEVIRDPGMMTALADAARRGVRVRVLITDNTDVGNRDAATTLANAGVQVRLVKRLYIHAKMILVDNARAFVGSENLTATSLDNNREVGMILSEPPLIQRCAATFNRDWSQAVAFAGQAPASAPSQPAQPQPTLPTMGLPMS